MTESILKTKFCIPRLRSPIVPRPLLVKRLNEGTEYRLVLLSAPAGYGKTTLVSEWIAECKYPVAWLSLDEKDNDLKQFILCIVKSLQSVLDGFGKSVPTMLQSMQNIGMEPILTILINEITARPENLILVLDDYHVIINQFVNDAIIFLLDYMPDHMRLVITTRVDPPLPLVRLRARNQLMEIRIPELKFTCSEIVEFLNCVMGLNLSDKNIKVLETQTEGWIAGLQLAAISMQGQSNNTDFINSFSGKHGFIMDYLIDEVLKQQTQELQAFLLQTSILDCLCGSLCDTVILDPTVAGQETLEYLQRVNMFIVPLDNERRWYRYHRLFADMLRNKLLAAFPLCAGNKDRDVAVLHMRASRWFEENGHIGEAVHHAIEAKEFERSAALIELAWEGMDKSLRSATWLGWVKRIPDEMIRVRPVLSAGYAWALLDAGKIEGCEQRLKDAEHCLEIMQADRKDQKAALFENIVVIDNKQLRLLPATISTAYAYRALALGDSKAALMYAQKALGLIPGNDYLSREIVNSLLCLAQWANGELEAAYNTIAAGKVNNHMELMVAVLLAELRMEQGKLNQALGIYEKSLRAAGHEEDLYQIPVASFYLGLSRIKLLNGDINGAEALLQQSMEKAEKVALPNWRYNWYLLKARIVEYRGVHDKALHLLYEAEKYYFRGPMPDLQPLDSLKARVLIKQGKIHKALDWMKEHHLTIEDELCYLNEFKYITVVRVLLAAYKYLNDGRMLSEAEYLIERLLHEAQNENRSGSIVEILILRALIKEANGDMELALESISEAILLAELDEYVFAFIDEGIEMSRLLSEPTIYETRPDFVSRLLSLMEEDKEAEPLSERELEILRLIAQGLSNRDICKRLYLALSTVKGYNQNLFGKLCVKNRTEAVSRARELGLL